MSVLCTDLRFTRDHIVWEVDDETLYTIQIYLNFKPEMRMAMLKLIRVL